MAVVENNKEMVPFEHYVGLFEKLDPIEAAQRCGVKYDAHYSISSVDPPELVRFIKDVHPDVIMEHARDKDGNIVVTRLDEGVLQEVAAAGNGAYVRAGNNEFGLNPIIEDIRKMEDEKYSSLVFEEYDEQFMYFLAIALFFFVLELLIGDRKSKKHLFNR